MFVLVRNRLVERRSSLLAVKLKAKDMAEIVLTFALEETSKKAGLLAVGGIQLAWGFKAKLKKLKQSLDSIRAVLHTGRDNDEKSFVKEWLQNLREVAYKVDDVLDEFGYEVLRQKDFDVQRILGEMLENLEGRSMMSNLDAIERRLQNNLEGKRFLLVLHDVWNKESNKWESLKDKDCLSKVSGSNGNVVLVTTRSQETASMMETRPGLQEGLQGKKFLLVLDDVWNEEPKEWESLKEELSIVCGSNGNVIMVTTRKRQTASIMETSPGHRHELKGLEDEECWSIIRKIVESGNDKASIPGNLEVIGKDIATKCGGVPLAAKMLGGLMRKSKEERHWLSIRNNPVMDSIGDDAGIFPILKLSFDHLPSYLKPCFAYCAMIPEDHDIRKDQLIQLWMAGGLLGTANDQSTED
ncbi:hypothetical protein Tsubulata_040192, partial [Turnera subulata]